jgi:hypothetical protein
MSTIETEYFVQEEDHDADGASAGWCNWSPHDTFAEALAAMSDLKSDHRPLGPLRVVRTVTETLATRPVRV